MGEFIEKKAIAPEVPHHNIKDYQQPARCFKKNKPLITIISANSHFKLF